MSNRTPVQAAARYRSRLTKRIFASGLVACAFVSSNAFAIFGMGDIVFDPTAYAKAVSEYKLQLDRWKATADHYRQQLITLGGLSFDASKLPTQGNNFPEVNPDYGLEDACRKRNDGGLLGSITSLFKPDANAEILGQQLEICRRIVRAENLKYNETVRFLNNLYSRQNELRTLDARRRNVGDQQGKLQAAYYDVQRYQQNAKMDMDNWQAMMTAYDGYIAQLNKYQQRLAQRALRGKQPDLLTAVVQGAALKKALDDRKDKD